MSFKIDGNRFKERGNTIATISGNKIREGSGGKTLLTLDGDRIREGSGGKTLATVRSGDLREGSGGRKLISMRDIDKKIDGPGGVSKAALWLYFIR